MGLRRETGRESSAELALGDGTVVRIRSVSPADAPALQRLPGRLSERSLELRFLGPLGELSDEKASRLARAEDADHLALAASTQTGATR